MSGVNLIYQTVWRSVPSSERQLVWLDAESRWMLLWLLYMKTSLGVDGRLLYPLGFDWRILRWLLRLGHGNCWRLSKVTSILVFGIFASPPEWLFHTTFTTSTNTNVTFASEVYVYNQFWIKAIRVAEYVVCYKNGLKGIPFELCCKIRPCCGPPQCSGTMPSEIHIARIGRYFR